jgi:hypothetical protein
MGLLGAVPISVLTDSYKASHYAQYPATKKMVAVRPPLLLWPLWLRWPCMRPGMRAVVLLLAAGPCTVLTSSPPPPPCTRQYGEFRNGYNKDEKDTRMAW